jgi:hypothetical protein
MIQYTSFISFFYSPTTRSLIFGLVSILNRLQAKDGLALINGTQMICAIGTEAIWRAQNAIKTADIIAALTLEALRGIIVHYFTLILHFRYLKHTYIHTNKQTNKQTISQFFIHKLLQLVECIVRGYSIE